MATEGERGHSRVQGAQRDQLRGRAGRGQGGHSVSAGGQKNKSTASASAFASAAAASGCWIRAERSLRSVKCGATEGRIPIDVHRWKAVQEVESTVGS